VHGDGSQTRDFTYVDTVCDVIATAIEQNISSPSPINLAFGTKTRISDLADLIDGITCHTAERNYVDARNADVKHSQADNSLLREMFPDVKATPLSDGLRTTISWMQSISTVA
jgi:UDP-glucose 4-epimerase